MKEALVVVLFRLLTLVVSEDAVESVSVSVLEGDSVTLMSGLTDIKTVQRIEWRVNGTRIDTFTDGRHLDDQTGDLKISNIRTTDSVPYKLSISSTGTSSKKEFNVKVVPDTEVKPVPVTVMKGDSVTLRADLTGIQTYGEIQWRFGEQTFPVPSLNITNITTQDTGLYEADITSNSSRYIIHKTFNVTISDEVVSVSVLEGDTVTLLTGLTEIQTDDQILWKSGDHEHIALLNGTVNKIWSNIDLNRQTGDLTIRNIQRGDYKVEVNTRRMISHRKYRINIVVSADEVKPVSAMKGDSVTLLTGLTDIQRDGEIRWRFGEQISLVAVVANSMTVYDDGPDGRFRGRLKLDNQTGSLTITDTTTQHTGVYEVSMNRSRYIIHKTFSMTVSIVPDTEVKPVPVTVMKGDSVTLLADLTGIQTYGEIRWRFGEQKFPVGVPSLTITNITTQHTGLYEADITSSSSRYIIHKTFNVTISVVPDTEVKPVPVTVMKGDSVTLRADLTGIQGYREIRWRFGKQTFPVGVPSLTITDITTQHTGLYEADITSSSRRYIIHKTFNVTISDEVVSVSVLEGDSVTLLTGLTEIQTDDQILWKSGDHEVIAHLNGPDTKNWSNIDPQTGDLNIRNVQREGDKVTYKVKINTRRMISHRKYRINIAVSADEVKSVSVMKGDSVTLLTGLTDIQRDGEIRWRFEEQKSPVAEIANSTTVYDDVLNEKFRGRLNLDQTGSLTIIDTTTQHTGVYKVSINRGRYIIHKTFNMTVSGKDAVNAVLTKAGKSVNLQIDTKIHNHELIQWMFENTTRAKMNESVKQLFEGLEETFKKRLLLDQTGSLSITNIRTTDSGLYTWSCKSSRYTIYKTTFVYVVPDLSLGEAVGIALLLAVAVAVGFSVGMTVYRSGQNRQRVNGEKQIYQSTEDHDHEETELQ